MEVATEALDFDFVILDRQISEVDEATRFAEDIVQTLTPGSCVVIKGKVRSECKRFVLFTQLIKYLFRIYLGHYE